MSCDTFGITHSPNDKGNCVRCGKIVPESLAARLIALEERVAKLEEKKGP